ncbi:hypothetical protein NRB_47830 [Novosphingobium sp. 11B]
MLSGDEQAEDAAYAPVGERPVDQFQRIARTDLAILDHPVVPARPARFHAPGVDLRPVEAMIELPAWLAALTHLDERGAHPPAIADEDVFLGQPIGRDILPEGAVIGQQRMVADRFAPPVIVVVGVVVDGLVRPAMDRKIGLAVPFEAQSVDLHPTLHRRLGDGARLVGRAERSDLAAKYGKNGERTRHDRALFLHERYAIKS